MHARAASSGSGQLQELVVLGIPAVRDQGARLEPNTRGRQPVEQFTPKDRIHKLGQFVSSKNLN